MALLGGLRSRSYGHGCERTSASRHGAEEQRLTDRRLEPHVVPRRAERYHPGVKFRILIEQDEDGRFIATCPSLPGCVSQGETRDEARPNIQDAIGGYPESLKKHGEAIPPPIEEDVVDVIT